MDHTYRGPAKVAFVRVSGNAKTGPIPVTTTSPGTCPRSCSYRRPNGGCYAAQHHLAGHWRRVDERGHEWSAYATFVASLPPGQVWRGQQAGDLSGKDERLNAADVRAVVDANQGRDGFTYSHYPVSHAGIKRANKARAEEGLEPLPVGTIEHNRAVLNDANFRGLAINVSCETFAEVDSMAGSGLPLVCVVPIGQTKNMRTPGGKRVVICPAVTREGIDCKKCQLCTRINRDVVIGFPAHGAQKNRISLTMVE